MRLFVCEFLTGGGFHAEALPPGLQRDAGGMFDALIRDLRRINGLELVTTRDARLEPVVESVAVIRAADNPRIIWSECLRSSDAAWMIAPESGGRLLALRQLADACGCRFIGSDAEAIRITASKAATMQYFSRHGMDCIETAVLGRGLPASEHGWVVKPDDGAGCEETVLLTEPEAIERRRRGCPDPEQYVVQPYIPGRHASLSVLYSENGCRILSCNDQDVTVDGGRFVSGLPRVHEWRDQSAGLQGFADAVGRAMPGLRGFTGIDYIATDAGPVLVEINPRLTTSYAGLRDILDFNPAERILRSFGCLSETTDCMNVRE